MSQKKEEFVFGPFSNRPIPSVLRDFSAPVILKQTVKKERLTFIFEHETDSFNRWEAGRQLCDDALLSMISNNSAADEMYLSSLKKLIDDDTIDPAFRALTLTLPSQDEVTQKCLDNGITPDPLVIHQSVEALNLAISNHLKTSLENIYEKYVVAKEYIPDACLLYTSPSPRDKRQSRMPSSA